MNVLYTYPMFKKLSRIHKIQVASKLRAVGYPSFRDQVFIFGLGGCGFVVAWPVMIKNEKHHTPKRKIGLHFARFAPKNTQHGESDCTLRGKGSLHA